VLRAGYTEVNVNPLYTPRELEYQLRDSGAEAVIVLDSYAAVAEQVIATTKVRPVIVGSMIEEASDKKMAYELGALPDTVTFHDAIAAG
jgi:long-chain acyl-CoA synthetase